MNKYNNNYKHFKSFSCQSPIGMLKEAEDEVGRKLKVQYFHSQDLKSSFPYFLPCNSHDVSLEKLVLDQLRIP